MNIDLFFDSVDTTQKLCHSIRATEVGDFSKSVFMEIHKAYGDEVQFSRFSYRSLVLTKDILLV